MKTITIQKWGNSYAVRIPKEVINRLSLSEGQSLRTQTTKDGKGILLTPAVRSSESLAKLLSRVTPKNNHTEVEWGVSVGKEVW